MAQQAIISLLGQRHSAAPSTPPPASANEAWVYLLNGQSNMEGIGRVSDLPAGNPLLVDRPEIQIWNHVSSRTVVWDTYRAGVNQQHENKSNAQGNYYDNVLYGPEGSFGYHMAQAFGRTIYLIKMAYGGSTLTPSTGRQWSKTAGDLYQLYLNEYVYPGMAALSAMGLNPVIKGLFRYQGESDSNGNPSAFAAALDQFSTDIKNSIGMPVLPWVETRIHAVMYNEGANSPTAQIIRDAQTAFVAANPTERKLLTVDECTQHDNVHIDGQITGQWLVGKKAAQLMAQFDGITIP